MNDTYSIDVQGLCKSFGGKPAVVDLSMQVKPGEIFGFLGPNGSGKTTTIRMLCGLLIPDKGTGTCLGYDIITQPNMIKQEFGYMTQRFSLYEDLSVYENLDFVARLYGVTERKKKVEASIEDLGLSQRSQQLAGTLSGGWKQRLALSAALIHNPRLLLLDEPTAGVDPAARREFWDKIHELATLGITILVSTHYMDEAERCTRLAYLSHGRILITGTANEVIAQSRLKTYQLTGGNMIELAKQLKKEDKIDQVVIFGKVLHISGYDDQALQTIITTLPKEISVRKIAPELEDVFIALINKENKD